MARIALGMALVLCGAGRRGPAELRAATAMRATRACWKARRSCSVGARSAPLSARGAHSPRILRACHRARRERGCAGAWLRCSICSRARRRRPIAGPPPERTTTKGSSSPMTGAARRGVRRARRLGLARGARGARASCREHAQMRLRSRVNTGAGLYGFGVGSTRRTRARDRASCRGCREADRHDRRAGATRHRATSTSRPRPSSSKPSCSADAAPTPPSCRRSIGGAPPPRASHRRSPAQHAH